MGRSLRKRRESSMKNKLSEVKLFGRKAIVILTALAVSLSLTAYAKKDKAATLNDFGWYFNNEYPVKGAKDLELWDLGGQWKGIINVVSEVDGEDQCRIVVADTTVDYMGYKIDVSMDVQERYSFPVKDPGSMEKLDTTPGTVMKFKGDWDDGPGSMDVESLNSDLRLVIENFKENDGRQYALGSVYNGRAEIGEAALFRDVD